MGGGILLLLLPALVVLPFLSPSTAEAAGPGIRVLLASLGRPTWIRVSGKGLRALGPSGPLRLPPPPWTFRIEGGGLEGPGGRILPETIRLRGEDFIRLDPQGKRLPGTLVLSAAGKGLRVVDELSMETYVQGVLAGELGNHWPYAALQAQAVAARTYALWYVSRRKGAAWDLTDTTFHQVYQGFQERGTPVATAAEDTAGMVLTWKGRLFPAWYHSVCGGHTAHAKSIFPGAPEIPPLEGVPCPWCKDAPFFRWKAGPFLPSRLEALFGLPPGEKVLALEGAVREKASGRWIMARLRTARSSGTLPFRRIQRELGLKSALILGVKTGPGGIRIEGGGWGHGVGLCQRGAVAMARAGRDWREILSFYYPGSRVTRRW